MPLVTKILKRMARQYLLYWQKTGSAPDGTPVYADPVEVKCRWDSRDTELQLPQGRSVISGAYILCSQSLLVGSIVLKGGTTVGSAIAVWQATNSYPGVPTVLEGAREVLKVNETPDFKVKSSLYEVFA